MASGRNRGVSPIESDGALQQFWSVPADALLAKLRTTPTGLTTHEAQQRLLSLGSGRIGKPATATTARLLARQFGSPLVLLLIVAAGLSIAVREATDTAVILTVVIASGLLGFWQEKRAARAVDALLALIRTRTTVLRGGKQNSVPLEDVVPGDIVVLSAGSAVPADCRVLEATDLFVDESTLTGESFAVKKRPGVSPPDALITARSGALFLGTHVATGQATAVVVLRGRQTELGKLSGRLGAAPPETEFERGIRHFGYMLLQVTLILSICVLGVNVALKRPVLESLLFTLALAVGLTPELLPAIVSVTLSHGARAMAKARVIVRRLGAIEDLGSMTLLCVDKTGTITEGVVKIDSVVDVDGNQNDKAHLFAYVNASMQSGFANPIDETIRNGRTFDIAAFTKVNEVPYDFTRKRLSVIVDNAGERILVTKGSVRNVLDVCTSVENSSGVRADMDTRRADIESRYTKLSGEGLRCLGIACRTLPSNAPGSRDEEKDMTFLGILALADPPKPGVAEQLVELSRLGVALKLVSGDSRLVVTTIARSVGLAVESVMTGDEIRQLSDPALRARAPNVDIFAEVDPNQKDRIIRALRADGTVVGFLGDGINDAVALHTADVGISVESAVDVTRQAADIVLLDKDLGVLAAGLREGRRAFANTLKYIFITTSANFGNMLSMAAASMFTSFLPLLPKQILLINFLTDLPSVTVATDKLDPELVERPRRWDTKMIRNFMIVFGLVSSVFDILTFAVLRIVLRSDVEQFRTGWFLESVISEILVLIVIRTQRPFYKSPMGTSLLAASILVALGSMLIPYTPLAETFGLVPVSAHALLLLAAITAGYLVASELAKRAFFGHYRGDVQTRAEIKPCLAS